MSIDQYQLLATARSLKGTKSKPAGRARTSGKLSPLVQQYLQASLSDNTRRAYSNDLRHFTAWGARIPCTPETVATYLAEHANTLSCGTLSRRVVAIGKAHTAVHLVSPCQSDIVKSTLRGIRRTSNHEHRKVRPALFSQVKEMVNEAEGVRGKRNRALLLIGFSGAFRRSELVSIRVEDIEYDPKGIIVHLHRSKTDQLGNGRRIAIPTLRGKYCPVKAVKEWLKVSGITSGAIFRNVNRHGQVMGNALTPQSVALIVKESVSAIGLDPTQFSGHSLRAGLVTSAAINGVSSWKICQQTGHKSDATMQGYIRDNNLFTNNPLGKIW
jgi:site-specific recombinase XerD